MNTLNFDTGIETFSVNDKTKVSFNPTDSAFVERLFDAFDTLDKKQDAYKEEIAKKADGAVTFTAET